MVFFKHAKNTFDKERMIRAAAKLSWLMYPSFIVEIWDQILAQAENIFLPCL
jgi:hypothetical protein